MLSNQNQNIDELKQKISILEKQYKLFQEKNLNLNMTRGKPCDEQLDLSNSLNVCLSADDYKSQDGTDCRNYGGLDGIIEARKLFADLLEISPDNVIVSGNSSLNLMYDSVVRAMLFTLPGSSKPWSDAGTIKFICPVPGYDRHFFVTQTLGIEMIPVPMTNEGPDMDIIEKLVAEDPSIKGMWSVPVYSNPDGIVYSEKTCVRMASMKTAADNFRIFLDNAYFVHHLYARKNNKIPDMISLCAENGHPDRVLEFASTSKITFAGAGISCVASSKANLAWIKRQMGAQTIGPDKLNQLRHVRFLKDAANVRGLMEKHAGILRPKFELVHELLEKNLSDSDFCRWSNPEGGYFISVYVMPGTASEVVRLSDDCGVALTPAGNTYPYGKDPDDSNIRLAPSYPPIDELKMAIEVFSVCVQLAAFRKQLADKNVD